MDNSLVVIGPEARSEMMRGVNDLANAVKVTLGPGGRNAVIERRFGAPLITKDGVTVALNIEFSDPAKNAGAQLVKEVASKTGNVAGDGTTTATVIAQAILREGVKAIAAGINPVGIKRGIDIAVSRITESLRAQARAIESHEIPRVASISANSDTSIGDIISEAIGRVGRDGVITVEDSKTCDTYLEVVDGLRFGRGYLSPFFVTDPEKMRVRLENPYILLSEKAINGIKPLMSVLEGVRASGRQLLVIARDVGTSALSSLAANHVEGVLSSCVVRAPGFGDNGKATLEDIAVLTGGKVVSEDIGMAFERLTLESLGQCESVVVDSESTTIIGGAGERDSVDKRVLSIRSGLEGAESDYERERMTDRLAGLSGGIAVIHIGAATEVELKERRARAEDSVHATKAAIEEGIVPGGGVALLRAAESLQDLRVSGDESFGVEIVKVSILEPLNMIAENSGAAGVAVRERIKGDGNPAFGYNADTGEYGDMFEMGVVDPVKVTRLALQNAASIAGLMLTTETLVVDAGKKEDGNEAQR